MSSSSSSSSSSSRSSTPEPTPKRKRDAKEEEAAGSDSDSSDDSDAEEGPEGPVLSHAEQRREKRRAKQEKLGLPVKKRKLPDGSAAISATGAPAKRQNSVWVGNLTFKTTTEALTEFFKDVGEITRIHMPTKASTAPGARAENRGFAYVDFTTPEAKKAAVAMSEQNLFGRKLLIKDGGDFTGRPAVPGADAAAAGGAAGEASKTHSKTAQKILRAQKQPPAPTLFLGNLGFEATEQSIRGLFEAHRPKQKEKEKAADADADGAAKPEPQDKWIRKVRMGTFEDSGLCKGFAFADFTSIEHATSVLVNPKNHLLDGRKLVVEYASADAVRRGAPKAKREDGGGAERRPYVRKEAKSRGPRQEKKLLREKTAGDAPARKADSYAAPSSAPPEAAADSGASTGYKRKGPKNRPKPGAALALAKRESAAIVPGQGKRVVFE
ncbi:hypothetical protein K438DRAFT_1706276 [Mycena galopus ATCC 62051]|nr:hypothetical protein K438DRAFT_1706276 [Mycena galopus ATCC 62051]